MRVNFLLGLGFVQLEDLNLFLPSKIHNVYIFTLQQSRYLASVTRVTCSITLPLLLFSDPIGSKQGNCSIFFTGHMSLTFRTPPVSPPQPSFTTGLRRVYSLELRPHLDLVNSPDSGLADPLLGSLGASGSSEHSFLPQSTIYNWSCDHFSKPLLTVVDDSDVIITKREERENYALDHISKCQHFCPSSSFFCLVLV